MIDERIEEKNKKEEKSEKMSAREPSPITEKVTKETL